MHLALRPFPHDEEHEVAGVGGLRIAKQVVVLIDVEDEAGIADHPCLDGTLQVAQGVPVFLEHGVHGPLGPAQKLIQPLDGSVEELEVIEVDVED
jgi:hypothetical protein